MCRDHSHHDHEHDNGHADQDPNFLEAVDHPEEKIYENPRAFVREVSGDRYDYKEEWERLRDPDNRVTKGGEIPMKSKTDRVEGSQVWGKSYVRPWKGITQSLQMHMVELAPEGDGKKHGHQNEALMYILEGEGYEIHDGEKYKWEAGNLVAIHGGCVHAHYSSDPENPCRALVIKPKALAQFLHLLYQGTVENPPNEPGKFADWTPENFSTESEKYSEDDDRGMSDEDEDY